MPNGIYIQLIDTNFLSFLLTDRIINSELNECAVCTSKIVQLWNCLCHQESKLFMGDGHRN